MDSGGRKVFVSARISGRWFPRNCGRCNVQAAYVGRCIIKKRNVHANWQGAKAPFVTGALRASRPTNRGIHRGPCKLDGRTGTRVWPVGYGC